MGVSEMSQEVATRSLILAPQSLADSPPTRHRLLCTFAFAGSLFTTLFLFLSAESSLWILCVPLAIGATVCFGASIVCLNAYLPDLGRSTPEVLQLHAQLQEARATLKSCSSRDGRGDSLLSASQALVRAEDDYNRAKGRATSFISSRGIAMGYASGIASLCLMLVPVSAMGSSLRGLKVAIAGSGIAWGVGTIRELDLASSLRRL